MRAHETAASGVYGVVRRLRKLCAVLREGPYDFRTITEKMPGNYDDGPSGQRRFRRDVPNLRALGYTVDRVGRPARWYVSAGPSFVSDEDVQAMIHVRDAFAGGHPQAPAVQRWLQKLTSQISGAQAKLWQRRPALRVPLEPAIDYSDCTALIEWLEEAIGKQQQIRFLYRSPTSPTPVLHRKLDPYQIDYTLSIGVNTSCPAAPKCKESGRIYLPPAKAPCTRTRVAILRTP